jgi:hypothetical protein
MPSRRSGLTVYRIGGRPHAAEPVNDVAFEADPFLNNGQVQLERDSLRTFPHGQRPREISRLCRLPLVSWSPGEEDHFIGVGIGIGHRRLRSSCAGPPARRVSRQGAGLSVAEREHHRRQRQPLWLILLAALTGSVTTWLHIRRDRP